MPAEFADTNIVIYAASAGPKAAAARTILRRSPTISVQVLNETLNILRKKRQLDWPEIEQRLGQLRSLLPVVDLTVRTHELGLQLARRYGLSVYDAMIVAAALDAGCAILWSEDMQDGMVVAGQLTIRNPFL
ncbi:PIN domain-containing protein [Geminicoccus flavidas]|uniref:PIN domain-containing protein n=1 Tax=Geminicoccus flavidas TaxID=2506407 RepID=UPI001359005D|nr:PIN domain-containing protein [Geminicoccus flavidas]